MAKSTGNRNHYHTQWAGQFGVAHELCPRCYLVTFTTGTAPRVGLLCQSPEGKPFSLQLKSVRGHNAFLFQPSLREQRIYLTNRITPEPKAPPPKTWKTKKKSKIAASLPMRSPCVPAPG